MHSFYKFLTVVFAPFLKLYFYSRCLYGKDKYESVKNHFGVATVKRPEGKLMWVHAVSIGESAAALTYIKHVKKLYPNINVLITTTTVTSADILAPKIAQIDGCYHQFAVVDNPFWVKKFLDYWKVDVAMFLESEIWPNIIYELHSRKIPTYLLNARLSPRSFARWKLLKTLFANTISKFSAILAQSKLDKERFAFFSPTNTFQTDNLKYANAVLPVNEALFGIFRHICAGKKVFVAASTHEKEEEIILAAHKQLKEQFDIVTIIIPRHLTRVKNICALLNRSGLSYALRSQTTEDTKAEIFCIDAFGEVGTFFALADVCFVGGSLVPIGGHNIYEPIASGKPVLHGSYMANALEVRDFLHREKVAFEVQNADDIAELCTKIFTDKKFAQQLSERIKNLSKNDALLQIDKIVKLKNIFGN